MKIVGFYIKEFFIQNKQYEVQNVTEKNRKKAQPKHYYRRPW